MATTTPSVDSLLGSLNKAQRHAVTATAPTVAILAGPGSGKTHTLTSRVAWLIQKEGYQPSDVIVATFTVKAAREMGERIAKSLGPEVARKVVLGTFHSISRRYLASYGKRIGLEQKFVIVDDGDSRAIIQRICKRLQLGVDPAQAKAWISKRKAKGSNPATAAGKSKKEANPALDECYVAYQDHLTRSNLLDFDDLLLRCVELLEKHPSCVKNVQAVLIDEYQDTNGVQYELMKLFAQARQRITVVGDPDQSIYGWRSAEVRNLYRLLREYPGTDEVSLEENYRSSQLILDVSLQMIQQDKKRYQKALLPVHSKGTRPVLRRLINSAKEGEWIVSEIRRAILMAGGMLKHEDIAILLRSATLSRHIETALGKSGISYRMIGGLKFYERKEIKVLLDYLRVVSQPDNNDPVTRIINVPRRGIGDVTVKSLIEEAEVNKISLWSLLCKHCRGDRKAKANIRPKMEQSLNTGLLRPIVNLQKKVDSLRTGDSVTLVDLIDQLIAQLNFEQYLKDEYPEDHEQRWANVQDFISLANDFMRDQGANDDEELPQVDGIEQTKDENMLDRFLANVSLASDAQKGSAEASQSAMVTISTIHAAKGLEWLIVFVPAVYDGSIPHSRSDDLDEERRLLYVAMTRAKTLLYLSCPVFASAGQGNASELSTFVAPLASSSFAAKGPSFDQPMLAAMAKILGRNAPQQKRIFEKLPPMFSIEDDMLPIEPLDSKKDTADGGTNSRPQKRQRMSLPETPSGVVEANGWQREYSTTMEQNAGFTMASLPGFVTAGAHKTAIEAVQPPATAKGGNRRKTAGQQPSDQSSLLGFVSQAKHNARPAPPQEPASRYSSFNRYQATAAKVARGQSRETPTAPAIDPELGQHKLSMPATLTRPQAPKPQEEGKRKQYSCFSSSPPRARSPEEARPQQENQSKPAISFHATTFISATSKGGVRRPTGLGPPPSMDRLRKPFKPLTMNRPSGPP